MTATNRRGQVLAFTLTILLLLSSVAIPVSGSIAASTTSPPTQDVPEPATATANPADVSNRASAEPSRTVETDPPTLSSVEWPTTRESVNQSGSAASSEVGHHEYPDARHLGYGAPTSGTYGQGVEFTVGGAPVPPSGAPKKQPETAFQNFLGHDDSGSSGTAAASLGNDDAGAPRVPTSIQEAIQAAKEGRLSELRARVNGQTLASAQDTSKITSMTVGEQSNALSTSLETQNQNVCPSGSPVRTFNVSAIETEIVYNKYGQHDPNGRMYVLDSKIDDLRRQVRNSPAASIENPNMNAMAPLVQPLTIRAHVGDCVKIQFTNHLKKSASIHAAGVSYDPNSSAGSVIGFNNASIAQPGETVSYTWHVEKTGAFYFTDKAQMILHDKDETLRQHGLFGSLVAYEKGTEWLDPKTGEPLKSGVKAMIKDPDGPDYRDFAVYYHDGMTMRNSDGSKPTWPHSDAEQSMYAMNYRGDPTGARLRERNESTCPACDKPELFYSSWVHGDPGGGDLVFPTYKGDPVTWRLIGAQVEEKHVDHHHGHRWRSEPGDADSNTQDAQAISAGATYTRDFVAGFGNGSARTAMGYEEAFESGGAGYVQGSPGDYIFHCHLFPHYAAGMWSIMRVYDKDTRDMNQSKPGIYKLQPLPDRAEPPAPTNASPGYPNFIPAKKDHRPPKPPGEIDGREPTKLEESALNGTGQTDPIMPGAPYVNPCPAGADVQRYNISIIATNITYNNAGDYDPAAKIYVLTKNVDEIRSGEMEPKPLVIRANVGQCVEINFTNQLPPEQEPNEVSMHVHFVGYDALGSDGVTLGYNYDEGAEPVGDNETRTVFPKNGTPYTVEASGTKSYRWYADERGTIFWHDHLIGFEEGMHGVFGALIVEPKGSKWLDPRTGEPIRTGTKAMIVDEDSQNHREFVLLFQDFVRLMDSSGNPINGPFTNAPLSDQGTMGINYANAPLYHRTDADPSQAFSSWEHGDPATPLLRTYPNEPVKIRLLQGTFEESHNFMISGVRWRQEQHDRNSPLKGVQSFGVSEQFVASFDAPKDNPADLEVEDHFYGSMAVDDLWNGMWGLFRVYGSEVDTLQPLPGHEAPDGLISQDELGLLNETDTTPERPPTAGQPCPATAEKRLYNVVAFQANISYNEYGDHDPYGVVFATKSDYLDWKTNGTELKPLTLRAEKGECLEITLTNKLPSNMSKHAGHPEVPVDADKWSPSSRISLHSTLLDYTARSSGITTGYNFEQTVAPGETITYRWHADKQVGASAIFDMADVRFHKAHGAYGALVVEPEGSKWLDPKTGEPGKATGPRAIIVQPNGTDFREYVVVMADGQYMVNADGTCPVPPVAHEDNPDKPCSQAHGEPEDQGFKSINYANEPLPRRIDGDDREAFAFSSRIHGDPATPVFEAYRGDPVKFRVVQGADKPRGISFRLGGHVFPYQSTEKTQYVGVRGEITPGVSVDVVPYGGAGGPQAIPGDYYYGATKLRSYVEGGLWGIFRVHGQPADVHPLPDRRPAAPTNLTVTTPNTNRASQLYLNWSDHPDPEVEGYNVYRALTDGGPYLQVNDGLVTNSSYRDTNLTAGTTHYYVVTAVDTYGQESPNSGQANGTTNPLVTVTSDTNQTLTAALRANVTLTVEAESDLGIQQVQLGIDNGTIVRNASYNNTTGLYEVVVDTTKLVSGEHVFEFGGSDEREHKHGHANDDKKHKKGKHEHEHEHENEGKHKGHKHKHESKERRTVTIDNVAPTADVSIGGTAAGSLTSTLSGTVSLGVDAADNHTVVETVRYRIDDGTWHTLTEQNASWNESIDTSVLADGDHTLTVSTEDAAGNVRTKTFELTVDNTAPTFDAYIDGTLLSLLDTVLSGDVDLSVDASDATSTVESVTFEIGDNGEKRAKDDDGDGVWKAVIDTTNYDNGDHVLKIKVVDAAGNTKVKTFDLSIDNDGLL